MDVALSFRGMLATLAKHRVEFILVGGVAAIFEGAPVATFDLDIVPLPSDVNRNRLLAALGELDARFLDPAGRTIFPDLEKLASLRVQRYQTRLGVLDVLSTIGHGLAYEDLENATTAFEVDGATVRTLSLAMVILSKEQANRDKDQAVLPILRRTLKLRDDNSRA